ncbi:MAG: NOP58 family protein [Candidatus Aenigmarchaeota archaeon]|nr:NOP58 family protein [Candidatus Aenigmarchaeota archaeon]
MKVYLIDCALGTFAVGEGGQLVGQQLAGRTGTELAKHIAALQKLEVTPARTALSQELGKKGYNIIQARLADTGSFLQGFAQLAEMLGSTAKANGMVSEACCLLAREGLKAQGKGKIIVQVIGMKDRLEEHLNMTGEKLREWYGLADPEGARTVKSHRELARLALEKGMAGAGMEFDAGDEEAIKDFAARYLASCETAERIEKYLEALAAQEMPNVATIAGSMLACRLLSLAGGIEKLARSPVSRIQLLGAEKALFRHMRTNSLAPKYGVLYAHPFIQQSSLDKKGKVARLLAAKISLAAKIDFFSKEDRSAELKKELEAKFAELVKVSPA